MQLPAAPQWSSQSSVWHPARFECSSRFIGGDVATRTMIYRGFERQNKPPAEIEFAGCSSCGEAPWNVDRVWGIRLSLLGETTRLKRKNKQRLRDGKFLHENLEIRLALVCCCLFMSCFHIILLRQLNIRTLLTNNALFGYIARLSKDTPAHQALRCQINLSRGRPPTREWRRPRGRSPQQVAGPDTLW